MTYTFNKEEHIHTLDGIPLHGVTTVLKVISKPQLIQWAANMAIGYIKDNCQQDELMRYLVQLADLDQAKVAHRKKKERAGDWGTAVHLAIEEWIKEGKEPKLEGTQKEVFDKFVAWAKENKIEFLESEKHVYSKNFWIGGVVDLVFKMDGKKFIGDIKTSSGIYNETFFQMGAYDLCLKEMEGYEDVVGYVAINLKKDGSMDIKMVDNMEQNRQAFIHALGLHKIINSINDEHKN